MAGEAD
jgi:hypothetical protein